MTSFRILQVRPEVYFKDIVCLYSSVVYRAPPPYLEEDRVEFREDETAQLNDAREGERVGQDDGPDLVVGADEVEGDEGEPVDGVDAVGEEDEPGLVEAARTLPRLEGVERGGDDQEEGEEEPGDEACVHT